MLRPKWGLLVSLCALGGGLFPLALFLLQGRTFSVPTAPKRPLPGREKSHPKSRAPGDLTEFALDFRHDVLRPLREGQTHAYHFSLKSGKLLQVEVVQKGVDVLLRLYAPAGDKLYVVDSPNERKGPEAFSLHAWESGQYRVEVVGAEGDGSYIIRVRNLRSASERDKLNSQAERLFYQAKELYADRSFDQAVDRYLEAERLWSITHNIERQADALNWAGVALKDGDRLERSLEVNKRALDLYQELGNHKGESIIINALANSYVQMGEVDIAYTYYLQALRLARSFHDPRIEGLSSLNLSLVEAQLGKTGDAFSHANDALTIARRLKRRVDEINALLAIGRIYLSMADLQDASDQFLECSRLLDSSPDEKLRAVVLSRMAETHEAAGRTDQALSYSRLALGILERNKDPHGQAVNLVAIGSILQRQGNFGEARQAQEKALAIFRQLSDGRGEAVACINLGVLYLDFKDWARARDAFQCGLSLSQKLKYREGELSAFYGMARSDLARGNPIGARSWLEKSLDLIETLHRDAAREDLQRAYSKAKQGTFDLLINILTGESATQRDIAEAFSVDERRRSKALLRSLVESRVRSAVKERADSTVLAGLEKIRVELGRQEAVRQRLEKEGLPTFQVIAAQRRLLAQRETLETRLRRDDPWFSKLSRPAPVSLGEAQKLLDEKTLLLKFHLSDERSLLWVIGKDHFEVKILPGRRAIEEKARRIRELLAKSRTGAIESEAMHLAGSLSQILLGDVAGRLGSKHLVIVPDGALNYIPLAIFPEPVGGTLANRVGGLSTSLISRHEIAYLPSTSALAAIRAEAAQRKKPSGLLAIFADPALDKETNSPLPYSRDEANRILQLIPRGSDVLKALGREATRELATSGRLSRYRILHFATHGLVNFAHPELSALELAKGKSDPREFHALTFGDIQSLYLPAYLVVLSACRTALGQEVEGEGLVGLSHAFMYAGASSVLVSLWNVNDESTPAFMEHFYRSLLVEKRNPSEALASAQRWMAAQPKWHSPYYWAGFVLQGEWR